MEHPVTERITGVNIPACQLLIGAGVPLHRIPDIRRFYQRDVAAKDPIAFETEVRFRAMAFAAQHAPVAFGSALLAPAHMRSPSSCPPLLPFFLLVLLSNACDLSSHHRRFHQQQL